MIYSEKTDKQSGTKEYAENLQKLLQNCHGGRAFKELFSKVFINSTKENIQTQNR